MVISANITILYGKSKCNHTKKHKHICHSTLLFVPLHFVRLPIMTEGLVSVIMPTYNTVDFLADSIESILNQTYTNLELLITDDCSSDKNTIDLLNKYAQKDDRVKLAFLKENLGPGVARNNAIERAQGQYIAFCDSDDRWMPKKLELQIAAMKNGGYTLCCSSYIISAGSSRSMSSLIFTGAKFSS